MTDGEDIVAVRARITGRVQGVWFRAWTKEQASARQLSGWVRNRSDGTVEALFCGPPGQVSEMLKQCWQGPRLAKVTDVTGEPVEEICDGPFEQWPTV